MTKKILIVSSSLRSGSNSEILAHEAERGATDAGNQVEFVNLKGKDIKFCIGCLSCQQTLKCVLKDDMADLIVKVQNADAVIFATPIYYYEMSGQLKTFLDRCNPLYSQENKFKDVYLITSAYDSSEHAADRAINGLKGWVECFEQSRFAGALIGGGVDAPKSAASRDDLLKKAYELGHNI
ncbi:MAG: flavodoxin family protein [Alphaproteobacteria bacterium]|nr:flavodoxin family protein [Alphaproteobacteria bacterium]